MTLRELIEAVAVWCGAVLAAGVLGTVIHAVAGGAR
jgi:hypothetical protein